MTTTLASGRSSILRLPIRSRPGRALKVLWNHLDLLITLGLVFAAWQPFYVLAKAPAAFRGDFLDVSWVADLVVRSGRGEWLGRDAIFTYGPLFQWLSGLPARLLGVSLGTILKTWYVLPHCTAILLVYATSGLLLERQPVWKRALFVLLAVVFWFVPDIRTAFDLTVFAVSVRLIPMLLQDRVRLLYAACPLALLVTTGFLISADTGTYSLGAIVVVTATVVLSRRADRSALRSAAWGAAAFMAFLGACVLVVNAAAGRLLDFHFWTATFQVLATYRWILAAPMSRADKAHLLSTVALAWTILVSRWTWVRRNPESATDRDTFAPAALLFSLVTLQSAFVRSDGAHVAVALFPTVALAGIALLRAHARRAAYIPAAAVVVLTLLFYPASRLFFPQKILADFRTFRASSATCEPDDRYFDGACFPKEQAEVLSRVTAALHADTAAPNDPVAVFPFENIFGVAARMPVSSTVVQNYQIGGEFLMGLQLRGLETRKPATAVYCEDVRLNPHVDGVPNLTRTPDVWFYLQQHYVATDEPSPGILVLARDEARPQRWQPQRVTLRAAALHYRIQSRRTRLDLGEVNWPAGADFLKLRLTIHYPIWWKILKPSHVTIELRHADGTVKSIWAVVPPNSPYSLWLYPWQEQELGRFFTIHRPGMEKHSPVTHLWLKIDPYDWVSVRPNAVTVHEVEAVRLDEN